MRQYAVRWLVVPAAVALAAVTLGDARGDFVVNINGKELRSRDRDAIRIDGTYGDLKIESSGGFARVKAVETADVNELILTDAILINTGSSSSPFSIVFAFDFGPNPSEKVKASVGIDGVFATGSGGGTLNFGTGFIFEGFIEGGRIDGVLSAVVGGMPSGTTFDQSGSDQRFLLGTRTLTGQLGINLGANERMALPGSARLGVQAVTPEPTGLVLLGSGVLVLFGRSVRASRARRRPGRPGAVPT
ncbi:MAG: hypothetical protein K2X87_04080 [Gemmataceae bacterium]|nr:hypothetical protein [Gemmataceae bacterium]